METKRFAAAVLFMAIGVFLLASSWANARPSVLPLTADTRAVYVAFLDVYVPALKRSAGSNPVFINLANTTAPFDLGSELSEDKNCFDGLTFENASRVHKQAHTLDSLAQQDIRLVNSAQASAIRKAIIHGEPAAIAGGVRLEPNLLEVSEIAFDATARFAALRYRFSCGQLCGQGGTIIFEQTGEAWRDSHRICLGWIA